MGMTCWAICTLFIPLLILYIHPSDHEQSTPSDHAMNFLNSDFSEAGTSSKLIDVDDHFTLHRKAGPFATLFWNTMVLPQRTAVNYQRNLLAYGVRAGIYGGVFPSFQGCALLLLIKYYFL
jgi:hypothetical protein